MRTHRLFAMIAVGIGLTTAWVGRARAGGFSINEHSAKVMGLAGAYTAVADSPATTFWNPAGLATLDGLQIEAGLTMISLAASYRGTVPGLGVESTVEAPTNVHWIPNLHASYRISDAVAAGLGVTFPYGLSAEWPESVDVNGAAVPWWGRGIVQRISLQTVYITPCVAVKVHPRIFVGAGISLVKGAVTLERSLIFSDSAEDDVDVKVSGEDWSVAASAGVLFKAIPNLLNLGVGYRSGAHFTFEGKAAFTKNGTGDQVSDALRTRLVDGDVEAPLELPHVVSFGAALFPLEALTVGVSLDLTTWSSYEELAIRFVGNEQLNSAEPKHWSNTVTFRLGAEYRVLPQLPLRAGFIYDQSPIPAATLGPELPDGDRYELTLGAGYELGSLRLDLAYQFITAAETRAAAVAPLEGAYSAGAHLAAASLSYHRDI
jgi:long-chain fatty acid transport protein